MANHKTYVGFLRTGTGSQRVELALAADTALIRLRYRWMVQDPMPVQCELRFTHKAVDSGHGLLELVGAATAADDDGELEPVPSLSQEQAMLPLIVEYLRVPPMPVHVHPESDLLAMRPTGYADWNDQFELLLLVDDGDGWPDDPFWEHVRGQLDKAKLTAYDYSSASES